jgi:hypothetical protein
MHNSEIKDASSAYHKRGDVFFAWRRDYNRRNWRAACSGLLSEISVGVGLLKLLKVVKEPTTASARAGRPVHH